MNKPEWIPAELVATDGIVVASCTLASLFSGKQIKASDGSMIRGRLHLPEYQRPYRWGEKELSRLLEDLVAYFSPTGKRPSHHLFLGSIILHQKNGNTLDIIDGQQRITSLGLLARMIKKGSEPKLRYASPISQRQIWHNYKWLSEQSLPLDAIDFKHINVTLVVTHSEDEAYRFFETQNTGGVRLGGEDIIKAHHLRAIPQGDQAEYAKYWEGLGELKTVVAAAMKARYWSLLDFRPLPSRQRPTAYKQAVVNELAECTLSMSGEDVAYQSVSVTRNGRGRFSAALPGEGYALRQPLNEGVNTINYLGYFVGLRDALLTKNRQSGLDQFHDFYQKLVCELPGAAYLKTLYDSVILAYVSRFGTEDLYEASLWLFRLVYSRRVTTKKAVKESSVGALVADAPVFDWIMSAFNHQQCIGALQSFKVVTNANNTDSGGKSVKERFMHMVMDWCGVYVKPSEIAEQYDNVLRKTIEQKIRSQVARNG